MSRIALVFLFAFVALAAADIWTNCGTATDHLKINSVTITPDPPVKGQNLTVVLDATLDETVTNGTVYLDVKFMTFITILNKNYPICGHNTVLPCPIQQGPYTRTISELIPSEAPGGSYSGNVKVTDQSSQEIACINFDLKL